MVTPPPERMLALLFVSESWQPMTAVGLRQLKTVADPRGASCMQDVHLPCPVPPEPCHSHIVSLTVRRTTALQTGVRYSGLEEGAR